MSTFRKLYYLPAVCLPLLGAHADNLPHAESNAFTFDALTVPTDSDNDGMPDAWELKYGLNINLDDSAANPDTDAFTNIEEYNAGQNPLIANDPDEVADESANFVFSTITYAADTDGDTIPDWWEDLYGLGSGTSNAHANPDGDAFTNIEEYNAGTNPNVADNISMLVGESTNSLIDTGAYYLGFSTDTDGDLMPDWWEDKYGLNRTVNDASDNPDGDELNNLEEYLAGRIPILDDQFGEGFNASGDFSTDTIGLAPDTDGDLMPDDWESFYGLNPLVFSANDDPDNDGWTNLEEYNAGTNPIVNEWIGPDRLASSNSLLDTGAFPLGFTHDSDNDGMPDWWELKYGLLVNTNDANGNPDGDSFLNLEEYQNGLIPNQSDYIFVIDAEGGIFVLDSGGEFVDSDLDGIPDWWERKHFGNETSTPATLDLDGDGQDNFSEYIAGLDPNDSSSVFKIESTDLEPEANGMMTIEWQSQPGRTYHVYFSETIGGLSGSPTYTVLGNGATISRSISKEGHSKLFCRISVELTESPE